ncbi:MAG: hypothetical protein WBA10_17950 [Elainellaceae cyanobacterium]
MVQATQPVSNVIAIAFDFDDTLVPDSYDAVIKSLGHEPKTFREERYYPLLNDGWDGIPARFYTLVDESKRQSEGKKITSEFFKAVGQQHVPFPGVPEMFGRLRQCCRDSNAEITLEFYLITSGFVEIARNTTIAEEFTAMWGCEFHYSESGEVVHLKHDVSHAEKPRYLHYLSKGVDSHSEDDLLFAYDDVADDELRLPLSQIIYVGDGTSDLPCFELLNAAGGTSIGVNKDGSDWAKKHKVTKSQRVDNLVPADYSEGSEMMASLLLAVESLCKRIQLRQLGTSA